jgi:hypothetical protein
MSTTHDDVFSLRIPRESNDRLLSARIRDAFDEKIGSSVELSGAELLAATLDDLVDIANLFSSLTEVLNSPPAVSGCPGSVGGGGTRTSPEIFALLLSHAPAPAERRRAARFSSDVRLGHACKSPTPARLASQLPDGPFRRRCCAHGMQAGIRAVLSKSIIQISRYDIVHNGMIQLGLSNS